MKLASAIVALVALLAGALWWVAEVAPESPIEIDNARVRLVPGGGPMAGYMEIANHTDAPVRVLGAASEAFAGVGIHRSLVADGRARMQPEPGGVEVRPGEAVAFEPRGLHLMLTGPKRALQVGDQVDIVLQFDGPDPAERPISFTVVPVTGQ